MGPGLKKWGKKALISNVGYVDLERRSHWPGLDFRRRREEREATQRNRRGKRRGGKRREGRLNSKRHMARALMLARVRRRANAETDRDMLAATTTWKWSVVR